MEASNGEHYLVECRILGDRLSDHLSVSIASNMIHDMVVNENGYIDVSYAVVVINTLPTFIGEVSSTLRYDSQNKEVVLNNHEVIILFD